MSGGQFARGDGALELETVIWKAPHVRERSELFLLEQVEGIEPPILTLDKGYVLTLNYTRVRELIIVQARVIDNKFIKRIGAVVFVSAAIIIRSSRPAIEAGLGDSNLEC